jgi:predicted ATPase/DNA-binding SARP family transcriptional activator
MLEIRMLGQFNLRQDGVPIELPSRPARTLLAYLLINLGIHHSRERLAGLLWPDSSEGNARKNLRQALWHLRKSIGDHHLLVDRVSIAFNVKSEFWLDIGLMEDPLNQDLEIVVSAYEGELLPGFYEDWVLLERDRMAAAYERQMQRLIDQCIQEQRWNDVIKWSERWIAQGQIPEAAFRALMSTYAAVGELSKVEAVYQRCGEALQQDIGVDPSEETTQLYQCLLSGEIPSRQTYEEPSGQTDSTAARQINLPAQPTAFIGRKEELAEIEAVLATNRLLTLIGPGGIGKTRLALRAAAEMADEFDNGCFFVSLAPIRVIDHLIQTIAEAVNFPLATFEDPQYQLLRFLKTRQLLLVMDNFEHLLDGVGIVSEILKSAPGVKILATSREKLNLQGENHFVVGGMGFTRQAKPADQGTDDAISLFEQSARKVRTGFRPSPDELDQIAKICQMVGGMPLAIELAAAWLYILSVEEINAELEKGFDILTTEMRDAPERHRSIRAVFDHSWSLLDQNEQEIFLLLSVFRGGFTREAAHQVGGASLQLLAELVNKSFVSHDSSSGRFEVHDLLRQYAQEQLAMTPELSVSALEAHAAYFAAFMHQNGEHLRGGGQMPALAQIDADIENVRAAWRFYLDQKNANQLWKFIWGLWHFYWIRWWNHSGMELFAEAARGLEGEHDEGTAALRALAKAFQAYFMAWLGLSDRGYLLAEESAKILEKHNCPEALLFAYDSLALNAYFLGRMTEESSAIDKMREIATNLEDEWLLAFTLFAASMAALLNEDYAEAERFAESNLKRYEEVGDVIGSTMPPIVLGHVALARKDYEKARGWYLRCYTVAEQVGFHYSTQTSSKYLGKVAVSMGDTAEAEKYLRRGLTITREIGFVRDIINLLYEVARLRVTQDKPEEAVELLALVLEHPASLLTRWLEGRISDNAKELLAKLEKDLPPETYTAALAQGQVMDLDTVVTGLLQASDA